MTEGPPFDTFRISEPYVPALRSIRRALSQRGLRIPVELDVSARIKQELGAVLVPCTVLYVDEPSVLLEALVFHRGAVTLIPQPISISAHGKETEVQLRSAESLIEGGLPTSIREPVLNLHDRISQAMESIGERQGAEALVRA